MRDRADRGAGPAANYLSQQGSSRRGMKLILSDGSSDYLFRPATVRIFSQALFVRKSDPKAVFPLYAKHVLPEWQGKTARQLPNYVERSLVAHFKETKCSNVADFCLEMYTRMGLLEGVRVERSSTPEFRARAVAVSDYFVDQRYEGEIVRARYRDGKFLLHKGGDRFLEIPGGEFGPKQISPTRDTRFRWMQSVIGCTHYIAGASEQHYINKADAPNVKFIKRDEISDFDKAYTEL